VEVSITDLQKISGRISQWKNCENRCSFADVVTKKQSVCFLLEHGVVIKVVSQVILSIHKCMQWRLYLY